jgi:hypothetical protein
MRSTYAIRAPHTLTQTCISQASPLATVESAAQAADMFLQKLTAASLRHSECGAVRCASWTHNAARCLQLAGVQQRSARIASFNWCGASTCLQLSVQSMCRQPPQVMSQHRKHGDSDEQAIDAATV